MTANQGRAEAQLLETWRREAQERRLAQVDLPPEAAPGAPGRPRRGKREKLRKTPETVEEKRMNNLEKN